MTIDQALLIPTLKTCVGIPAETIADILALVPTAASPPQTIAKPENTSRDTDNTISPDPHLVFSGVTAGLYNVKAMILVDAASATPDFKFQWTLTGGGIFGDFNIVTLSQNESSSGNSSVSEIAAAIDTVIGISTNVRGLLIINLLAEITTGGTLNFSWSQNTSNAVPTTVVKDSFAILTPLTLAA